MSERATAFIELRKIELTHRALVFEARCYAEGAQYGLVSLNTASPRAPRTTPPQCERPVNVYHESLSSHSQGDCDLGGRPGRRREDDEHGWLQPTTPTRAPTPPLRAGRAITRAFQERAARPHCATITGPQCSVRFAVRLAVRGRLLPGGRRVRGASNSARQRAVSEPEMKWRRETSR